MFKKFQRKIDLSPLESPGRKQTRAEHALPCTLLLPTWKTVLKAKLHKTFYIKEIMKKKKGSLEVVAKVIAKERLILTNGTREPVCGSVTKGPLKPGLQLQTR